MKKMGFTKSKWTLLKSKLALLTLVLFGLVGQQNLAAQVQATFDSDGDNTCNVERLEECGGTVDSGDLRFTDDGTNDGNYADSRIRRDTVELCPKDKWHRVKVVFTDFDLEAGDTLYAFEGDKAAVRASGGLATPNNPLGCGSGSGVGVARAFGGWKDASCSPQINPTGCLTFLFVTDGDNRKGAGWDAWVDCEERDVSLTDIEVSDERLACDEFSVMKTIFAPFVVACGDTLANGEDSVRLVITNQHGDVHLDTCLIRNGGNQLAERFFTIGQYRVEASLKADPTKNTSSTFSVQAPALVCNDEVNIPLGAACAVTVRPDDVLEQPCEASRYLQYNITVTIPGANGAKDVVINTTGHDGLGGVVYPTITGDDIKAAGLTACNVVANVSIERIYYGDRDGDGQPDIPAGTMSTPVCDNGTQALACGTVLNLSDVDAPWVNVTAVPDTVIACDGSTLADMVAASGVDNCDDDVEVEVEISLDEDDPCFAANGMPNETVATVLFTATDACGNVGTAQRTIRVIRPDLNDPRFVAKAADVQVECNETGVAPTPGVIIGAWKNGAFVADTRDTVSLSTTEYICGYILTTEEEDVPSTDCGSKKFVYYSALDWCSTSGGILPIDTVFIENTDTEAPSFDAGTAAATDIELDHFSCTYDVAKLPVPSASDVCDENPSVRLDRVQRVENGTLWTVDPSEWSALDCDTFELRWIAEDDCHEQLVNDTVIQTITILDVTKPSAACVDQLNVSVPNEWGARVFVDDIDAGSFDACGIASREIRIVGSGAAWSDQVDIGCEYVHSNVQIEMRVIDNKGNENICWLDVLVEDKINPICEALPDEQGFCDEYHNGELGASTDVNEDFEMSNSEYVALTGDLLAVYNAEFGDPAALKVCEDNLNSAVCGSLEFEQQYQLIAWPCGQINAKRRYRVRDWSGNYSSWVEQRITIDYRQNWSITFPADWEGSCGDLAPAEDIEINNGACDLLGVEVTERQFEVPGDACFKIERTYHVINWCTFQAGQDPVEIARVEGDHGFADGLTVTSEGNESNGYWTYIQVLRVHDDEAPVITIIDPEPCINGVDFDALPYGEEDVTPGAAPFECDELKTWSAIATDCSSNITWEGRLFNSNTGELVATSNTNEISFIVSNKESYFAEFWAFDGCGNSAGNKGEPVLFWDCKKPTPYVLNGVAVELGQTGSVQVWATDLDQNSFDNCTDQSLLDFRIWADFLGEAPTDLAGVQSLGKVIEFDCDRIGTNVVFIYVIDEEGNFDVVETFVNVQDNMSACSGVEPNAGMVAGRIVNPQGENVESVEVAISGGVNESMTTGADGYYQFELVSGADYTVTPTKDINPLNGVSTFDLVLISKHILGITQFDTPYKYVAADVNKSGTITAFDMVQLRQLILNITEEFPANDSWRFVDASYEFTTPNPASENFGEFYTINTLSGDMMNMDFVGVKVGDVNGNASANNLLGAESRSTVGTYNLTAQDRFVEAGEQVKVEFGSQGTAQGYQFTMNYAGTKGQIVEGVAKAANFNTALAERGAIAASWNGEANEEVQFALTFTATTSGLLSELVSISSDMTRAEAYNEAGELMNVSIDFTAPTATGFELSQNTPNPFKGETVIGFNLPVAGQASLTVMDAQGKVVKFISGDYAKGYNNITLKSNDLNATGAVSYTHLTLPTILLV